MIVAPDGVNMSAASCFDIVSAYCGLCSVRILVMYAVYVCVSAKALQGKRKRLAEADVKVK